VTVDPTLGYEFVKERLDQVTQVRLLLSICGPAVLPQLLSQLSRAGEIPLRAGNEHSSRRQAFESDISSLHVLKEGSEKFLHQKHALSHF
jgi:hypothetical protein